MECCHSVLLDKSLPLCLLESRECAAPSKGLGRVQSQESPRRIRSVCCQTKHWARPNASVSVESCRPGGTKALDRMKEQAHQTESSCCDNLLSEPSPLPSASLNLLLQRALGQGGHAGDSVNWEAEFLQPQQGVSTPSKTRVHSPRPRDDFDTWLEATGHKPRRLESVPAGLSPYGGKNPAA